LKIMWNRKETGLSWQQQKRNQTSVSHQNRHESGIYGIIGFLGPLLSSGVGALPGKRTKCQVVDIGWCPGLHHLVILGVGDWLPTHMHTTTTHNNYE
jgi:hypothetical protein